MVLPGNLLHLFPPACTVHVFACATRSSLKQVINVAHDVHSRDTDTDTGLPL